MHKYIMKHAVVTFLTIVLVVSCVGCSSGKPKDGIETNTDPAIYATPEEQYAVLDEHFPDYRDIQLALNGSVPNNNKDAGMIVIPGLKTTRALNKEGKAEACEEMTPQGLAVTDKYVFISAYCHGKKHHSVLYMIDLKTGEYIKTIDLPSMAHVGGLAYDRGNELIWIAEKIDGQAAVAAVKLSDLESYKENSDQSAEYVTTHLFPNIKAASYICYYDHMIYVGTFTQKEEVMTYGYVIKDKGMIEDQPVVAAQMDPKVQGLAIGDGYVLIAKSYGPDNSIMQLFSIDDPEKQLYDLTGRKALFSMELPQKLEQIVLTENAIYELHESAAAEYRVRNSDHVDRVIFMTADEMERLIEIIQQYTDVE